MDMRSLHRYAVESTGRVIDRLRDGDLDRPSPCAAWTARDVVEHIVDNHRNLLRQLGRGEDADPAGGDPRAGYWKTVNAVADAAGEDGALDRPFQLGGYGEITAGNALAVYFADVLVHGWDLARAAGLDIEIADELSTVAAKIVSRYPEQSWGPDRAFSEKREAPEGASATERLLALCGRDVNWRPPVTAGG